MKILLAVDDSIFSEAAIQSVASRRWPTGTVVRVLSAVEYVAPPSMPELWFEAGGSLEEVRAAIKTHAEEVTARAAEMLKPCECAVETVVRVGDARSVIVDEAKDWSADLIVVGSHGYSGIKRWLLGSVAHSVVSHAPCSVEVVRAKNRD